MDKTKLEFLKDLGITVGHSSGGGIFPVMASFYGHSDFNKFTITEYMPRNYIFTDAMINKLLFAAYNNGVQEGRMSVQQNFRELLGIDSNTEEE